MSLCWLLGHKWFYAGYNVGMGFGSPYVYFKQCMKCGRIEIDPEALKLKDEPE